RGSSTATSPAPTDRHLTPGAGAASVSSHGRHACGGDIPAARVSPGMVGRRGLLRLRLSPGGPPGTLARLRAHTADRRGNRLGFLLPNDASSKGARPMTATATQDAAQLAREAGLNPVDYLRARGYVYDVSDEAELRAAFARGTVTVYVGFD